MSIYLLIVYSSQIIKRFTLTFNITSLFPPTFGDRVSRKSWLALTSYPHFPSDRITGMRLLAWFNVTFKLFRKDKEWRKVYHFILKCQSLKEQEQYTTLRTKEPCAQEAELCSLRLAWLTKCSPGQSGLLRRETLSQKQHKQQRPKYICSITLGHLCIYHNPRFL